MQTGKPRLQSLFLFSVFFPPIFRLAFLFCKTPRPGGGRSARSYSFLSAVQATALRPAALQTPDKESRNS